MRIKPESFEAAAAGPGGSKKKTGPGTRASRASDHAAKRILARHIERDYFGNPIYAKDPDEGLSPAAVMRKHNDMVRLDAWLVAKGYAGSREKAKELVAQGLVHVQHVTRVKPSTPIGAKTRVNVDIEEPGATEAEAAGPGSEEPGPAEPGQAAAPEADGRA